MCGHEVEVDDALKEANRQLDVSANDISHLAFSRKWAANAGTRLA